MTVSSRILGVALIALCSAACEGDPAESDPPDLAPPPPGCATHEFDPCAGGEGRMLELASGLHIAEPEPIDYPDSPPASGPHRPDWARWGEYSDLDPPRWLHNLEHGGVALLYHPCAGAETIEALRAYAAAHPGDAGGPFRYILAPYADLPEGARVAVVTWGWRYLAPCARPDEIEEFVARRYRMAPEDIAGDGRYSEGWLRR